MSRGKGQRHTSNPSHEVCLPQEQTYGEIVADWLQRQRWDYFVTVTLRQCALSEYDSVAVCQRLCTPLCKYYRTRRRDAISLIRDIRKTTGDVERIFLACEPHKYSRNLHAHGLVAEWEPAYLPERSDVYGQYSRLSLWHDYFREFGRSRVEPVNNVGQVSAYCSKYVTKYTDGDNFDFIGNSWES